MAVIVKKAPHFDEESSKLGATPENIKSAESALELALAGRKDLVSVMDIKVTQQDPNSRHWRRIKVLKSGVRVVFEAWFENEDLIVLIHCVMPKASWTYEEIVSLWQKYRTRIAP